MVLREKKIKNSKNWYLKYLFVETSVCPNLCLSKLKGGKLDSEVFYNESTVCDSKKPKIFEGLSQLSIEAEDIKSGVGIVLNPIDKIIPQNCFPASNWPQ